jgi:hypothetical protein
MTHRDMRSQALFGLTLLPPGCNLVVHPIVHTKLAVGNSEPLWLSFVSTLTDIRREAWLKIIGIRHVFCRKCDEHIRLRRFHEMPNAWVADVHRCPEEMPKKGETKISSAKDIAEALRTCIKGG